ncbi:MAG TPA: DUF4403 family protein [Xanthobacteraceae bacterium]|nr:DUF4403 family protein [Xanthobacteraceae bacterium]
MIILPRRKKILLAAVLVALLGGGALWALDSYLPFGLSELRQPQLAETPPLKPHAPTSTIVVPITIPLPAISASLDAATPRSFSGKRENPMFMPFGKTDINWRISRGPLIVDGRPEGLTLSTTLTGTLHITDQAKSRRSEATASAGSDLQRWVQDLIADALDQRGDVRATARLTVQPALLSSWRVDPHLKGQISIPEGGLRIAGVAIEVTDEVKAAIDTAVSDELKRMQARLRAHPLLEQIARREWAKMCGSISLAGVAAGNPNLHLELRPMRLIASQPVIDATSLRLTVGAETQARVTAQPNMPDCAFPPRLDIVKPVQEGRFFVTAPIELPFNEFNRLLSQQLANRTVPEQAIAGQITVHRVHVLPSGERLLIALRVTAREQASWLGLGATATVYLSAKPQLDREQQVLRLNDMSIDVQSRAGFGLFGIAARAALPYFADSIAQNAVIDLKPFIAGARTGIEAAIAQFDRADDGISADFAVTDLRIVGVEFDSKILRFMAEAEGTAKLTVSKLPDRQP